MEYKIERWRVTIWELAKALGLAESNLPDKIYIVRSSTDPDYFNVRAVTMKKVELRQDPDGVMRP